MDKYKIIGNISAGAHGIVLKAIRSSNHGTDLRSTEDRDEKLFAIKRIFIRKKSLSISVIREIKSLQLLNKHMNVSFITKIAVDITILDANTNICRKFQTIGHSIIGCFCTRFVC